MPHRTTRTRLGWMLAVVLASSISLYALADRYLIQHVEIADASAYAARVTQTTASVVAASSAGPAANSAVGDASFPASVDGPILKDAWDAQSNGVSIAISEVTSGSGSSKVTYFVAEVLLSNAEQLRSAFANNSFGRNIIANTSTIAAQNDALFAINGDYYGFRSDGIVIRNGVIFRDIPARAGLAFTSDGSMQVYDETTTSAQALLDAGVWNTLSFGPALIDDGVITANLGTVNVDTNLGNHPIQGNQPRTGIGMISANHFIFVVVDGRSKGYSRGLNLTEFAQLFADMGCSEAYNLDGGGSSTMYFQGDVVNNPLGKNRERGTSDILYIGS